jgi:hypothetical protein
MDQGRQQVKQPSKALLFHSQDARRAKDNARDSLRSLAEANRELGRVLERERIIALLGSYIPDPHESHEDCCECDTIRYLIALIKGDNK